MLPIPRRTITVARHSFFTSIRHASSRPTDLHPDDSGRLTGSAKLFADAEKEEHLSSHSSRDDLVHTQGPIWTGEESQYDNVLRMLVDAHKPLRSGGVKPTSSDDKIHNWMKTFDPQPRSSVSSIKSTKSMSAENGNDSEVKSDDIETKQQEQEQMTPHRTTIPPHLHRPWHSTYTGSSSSQDQTPKVKYGTFLQKRASGDSLVNDLELRLPHGADGKNRQKIREARKAGKMVRRYENAREGAIDYKLGLGEVVTGVNVDQDGQFRGNRQMKGSSVLGAGKGGSSGLRAWAGLVEDRIQRARERSEVTGVVFEVCRDGRSHAESGYLKVTTGLGKPIARDPEAGNPHIETGELLMNRIVKRQGALPPWIELQNTLDAGLSSFRSTLLSTYTTHLVRTVMSTNSLHPLPPLHLIPGNDEAWEARERKFHQENVKQINDLVRRMNAQAPTVVRRPLIDLEVELEKVRGEQLRQSVWEEIKRRAEDISLRQGSSPSQKSGPGFLIDPDSIAKLKQATRRSLWTIARPVASVLSKGVSGYSEGENQGHGHNNGATSDQANSPTSSPVRFLIITGVGLGLLVYLRQPVKNDSLSPEYIPIHSTSISASQEPAQIVAASPAEPRLTLILAFQIYIFEPIATLVRFFHLALLFGPVILLSPMLVVGKPSNPRRRGKPVMDEEENWGALWWYSFLVKQMERAGPSFIKLGQWAASRADLFPSALCDRLSKLHSNGDPHSIRHTRRVIEHAFGLRFDDIFETFEDKPIGCGAIAQVYRATLKPKVLPVSARKEVEAQRRDPEGENDDEQLSTSVAIKVLHPRVRKLVRRDIAIMSVFARIVNALPGMQWISLPEEVAVFGEMMNSQLDLRVEAANLERFDANFRKRGRMVKFPRAIRLGKDGGSMGREESRDVLIEEFEDALALKWFMKHGGGPFDERIATIGLDAFLEMLLLDNWTHGDLHPGNIMVRFYKPTSTDYLSPLIDRFTGSHRSPSPPPTIPHISKSSSELISLLSSQTHDRESWLNHLTALADQGYSPQLVFIDAGLVTSLNDRNRKDFLDLFQAVAEFDGYRAGKLMVERCRTPELVIDEETFALKIQHIILSIKSKTFSLSRIKISDILTDVLKAIRQHHVKLEGDFVNTVISILLLEGIGRQLDPDMDLFKSALPILRQLGRQMGTRDVIASTPKGNIWAMIKLWVWIEAREVAGSVSAFDEWIKVGQCFMF
ncbi:Atypical/ABC1/ABC1-C protein kinase [Tremella mesenterica]|uniref:Atypical/ABC1/ABC1-C protein kinase n=1 Tax=Tremella mesenterica TaxID=5217 RepID=A0A4Q1B8U7_TREME|nr:Atypical/ABC1/ABC1-C protein kinase [Tremella mesenterica]